MDMTVREALSILGPERVRKGMRAFEHPPMCDYSGCFMGAAFAPGEYVGMRSMDFINQYGGEAWSAFHMPRREWVRQGMTQAVAQVVLSMAYERGTWEFKQECVAFLAEHGQAIEPSVEVRHEVLA